MVRQAAAAPAAQTHVLASSALRMRCLINRHPPPRPRPCPPATLRVSERVVMMMQARRPRPRAATPARPPPALRLTLPHAMAPQPAARHGARPATDMVRALLLLLLLLFAAPGRTMCLQPGPGRTMGWCLRRGQLQWFTWWVMAARPRRRLRRTGGWRAGGPADCVHDRVGGVGGSPD